MQGILLVDKPKTWTSFDVVNYVRKIVANEAGKKPKHVKVGHTGTLDPLATGLLVLLIGKEYTKKAAELSKQDKTYEVTMKLGETSTTGDAEGKIVPYGMSSRALAERSLHSGRDDNLPSKKALQAALEALQGHIMQKPPIYSAVKIDGQRAYKLAREGKTVELEARPVTIHSLKLTDYTYPYVRFTAKVSSGTYIRSLVEDLGKKLETGAYMTDLRRTRVGLFNLSSAQTIESLQADTLATNLLTT